MIDIAVLPTPFLLTNPKVDVGRKWFHVRKFAARSVAAKRVAIYPINDALKVFIFCLFRKAINPIVNVERKLHCSGSIIKEPVARLRLLKCESSEWHTSGKKNT